MSDEQAKTGRFIASDYFPGGPRQTRLAEAIAAALDATAEAARRDERLAIWKSVLHREAMHPGEVANAMNALSAWICRRGEADTPSLTDLATLKEAVVEKATGAWRAAERRGAMAYNDPGRPVAQIEQWQAVKEMHEACAALAAAQEKESAK